MHEILAILNKMPDKAGGIDKLNFKVLKNMSDAYICRPIQYIFNLSVLHNTWPKSLKVAEIVPIYKGSHKYLTTNYRPISLISNLTKIFEKLIHSHLPKFLNNNNIICNKQYGFIKNIGTKEALAHLTGILYKNLDNKLTTIVSILDLSKAFDTINHEILLQKPEPGERLLS